MNLLLDTHVALWWASSPTVLSRRSKESIEHAEAAVHVSAASAWELAIKVRRGRLSVEVGRLFDDLARRDVSILGMGVRDCVKAGELEWDHRDPFDRMLVAQALSSGLTLVTRDGAILESSMVSCLAA